MKILVPIFAVLAAIFLIAGYSTLLHMIFPPLSYTYAMLASLGLIVLIFLALRKMKFITK
jgi:hypothetical protein